METARGNLSTSAEIIMSQLYARGAFKLVYKGTYTSGPRQGQECVAKMFESGSVYEEGFFQSELGVIEAAMDLIKKYNQGKFINRHIYLNQPAVWTFQPGSNYAGQKHLLEPFVENFQKFNSNTGWRDADGTAWSDVMQSISHFSYHTSGGNFVLCDLQGGVYSDGAVLTDPVVMSAARKFGPTDLGRDGISTFFARHVCTEYCRAQWTKPYSPQAFFPEREGTSMMEVPTRHTRSPLTYHPHHG